MENNASSHSLKPQRPATATSRRPTGALAAVLNQSAYERYNENTLTVKLGENYTKLLSSSTNILSCQSGLNAAGSPLIEGTNVVGKNKTADIDDTAKMFLSNTPRPSKIPLHKLFQTSTLTENPGNSRGGKGAIGIKTCLNTRPDSKRNARALIRISQQSTQKGRLTLPRSYINRSISTINAVVDHISNECQLTVRDRRQQPFDRMTGRELPSQNSRPQTARPRNGRRDRETQQWMEPNNQRLICLAMYKELLHRIDDHENRMFYHNNNFCANKLTEATLQQKEGTNQELAALRQLMVDETYNTEMASLIAQEKQQHQQYWRHFRYQQYKNASVGSSDDDEGAIEQMEQSSDLYIDNQSRRSESRTDSCSSSVSDTTKSEVNESQYQKDVDYKAQSVKGGQQRDNSRISLLHQCVPPVVEAVRRARQRVLSSKKGSIFTAVPPLISKCRPATARSSATGRSTVSIVDTYNCRFAPVCPLTKAQRATETDAHYFEGLAEAFGQPLHPKQHVCQRPYFGVWGIKNDRFGTGVAFSSRKPPLMPTNANR